MSELLNLFGLGAGVALYMSLYGVDQYIIQYDQELGPPWRNKDAWAKMSFGFFNADGIVRICDGSFGCSELPEGAPIELMPTAVYTRETVSSPAGVDSSRRLAASISA